MADALHRSPQYMLDIRQFILHEDYIFLSGSGTRETASLTYVPLRSVQYAGQTGSQFKQMVIRLMTRVAHLQGEYIQRILDLCDRNEFELGLLKELLLQGMKAGTESASVKGESMEGRAFHQPTLSYLLIPHRGTILIVAEHTGKSIGRLCRRFRSLNGSIGSNRP